MVLEPLEHACHKYARLMLKYIFRHVAHLFMMRFRLDLCDALSTAQAAAD